MKIVLLLLILTLASAFVMQQAVPATFPPAQKGLGFENSKGLLFQQEWMTSFKSFAISASTFYGNSYLDNLKFLVTQMTNTYSVHFNVFIQTSPAYYNHYAITSTYGESYASFGPGSNNVQPQWSYLVFVSRQYVFPMSYVYTSSVAQGTGFTSDQIQKIKDAILNNEVPTACYCTSTLFSNIFSAISNFATNIICQSNTPTYSYFEANQDQWIVISPRNCYYTIWNNS